MSFLWDAVFIQVLDRTGPLMLDPSETPIDNGQKISPENAAPTHGTDVVTQETTIKRKDNDFTKPQGRLQAAYVRS
jgi:hypothetical protein